MYTTLKKGAQYRDMSQEIDDTTLAGAPIYRNIAGAGDDNLMLTNSSRDPTGQVFSVLFNKQFDWGMDLMLGYAWTDSEDTGSMTSSTGPSNYENVATNNINDPRAATSNYNVESRVTLRASFEREFWGDNRTRFTLMGYYGSGQHGTYTMSSDDELQDEFSDRHLLYVPDGPSDPNVIFDAGFDQTAFFAWADNKGLKGGKFVGRNSIDSKVSSRFDLRIDQEIPLFFDDLKARAFFKIYNFTNMLSDDWGRQNDARFDSASVVNVSLDPSGAYYFESFSPQAVNEQQDISSVWEMRLGLDINFRLTKLDARPKASPRAGLFLWARFDSDDQRPVVRYTELFRGVVASRSSAVGDLRGAPVCKSSRTGHDLPRCSCFAGRCKQDHVEE